MRISGLWIWLLGVGSMQSSLTAMWVISIPHHGFTEGFWGITSIFFFFAMYVVTLPLMMSGYLD